MTMIVKDTKWRESGSSESLGLLYGLHSCRRLKENKRYCLFNIHVQLEKKLQVLFLMYISLCVRTDLCHSVVPRKVSPRSGRLSAGKSRR